MIRAALWGAGLLAWGLAIWRIMERRPHARIPWSVCFALGAAVAVPVLFAGALFGLVVPFAWGLSVVGIAGFALGSLKRGFPQFLPGRELLRDRLAVVLLGVAILGWLAGVPLLPKPHVSYDILSYHLPLAHAVAGDTGLRYVPGDFYSRLPQAASLLYAPALSDRSSTLDDPGIRVLIWLAVVAGSLLCGRLAGQLGARRRGRWAAVALYAWHPIVWAGQLNAHSDLLTAMFALAAFERLLSALAPTRPRLSALLLAGFFAGTAAAVKFSALGIVAVPLGMVAVIGGLRQRHSPDARRAVMVGAIVSIGILTGLGLWFVRSTALAGNPLHPFKGEAPGWSAEQAAFVVEQHHPRSPISAEYWEAAFTRTTVFGYAIPFLPISVLLLAALGGVALRRPAPRLLLFAAAAGYGAWLLVGLNPDRFVLPAIGLATAVAARATFVRGARPLQFAGAGALGLLLLSTMLEERPLAVARADEIWDRNKIIPVELLMATRESSGDGAPLLVFEARSRLFPEASNVCTVWDVPTWSEDLKASDSADDFANRLREQGLTMLFVNEFEFGRLVDFYGGLEGSRLMGEIGMRSMPNEVDRAMAAYPSIRFAGLDTRNRRVLYEFLVLCRRNAIRTIPVGPVSEIWVAPIPASANTATDQN
ncbi:hypothetical protein KQI84_14600 [bacterium]|nr:hypothetical protein [bacterium]